MKFTDSHEWVSLEDGIATVGITTFAQKELGEVVYVELPQLGTSVQATQAVAILESTKAAVDVYTPLSGEVVAVNEALRSDCRLLNISPEEHGWLLRLRIRHPAEYNSLLDKKAYVQLVLQVSGQY